MPKAYVHNICLRGGGRPLCLDETVPSPHTRTKRSIKNTFALMTSVGIRQKRKIRTHTRWILTTRLLTNRSTAESKPLLVICLNASLTNGTFHVILDQWKSYFCRLSARPSVYYGRPVYPAERNPLCLRQWDIKGECKLQITVPLFRGFKGNKTTFYV